MHPPIKRNVVTTQNKYKKLKPSLVASYTTRHADWKWKGPILNSVLHKYVTYLLRHLSSYS